MKIIKYNKLVRDNIIGIIQSKDKKVKFHIANDKEYLQYLILKLNEEIKEFNVDYSIEELADIIEVINAIKKTSKYSNVEERRLKKLKSNGGFDKKIVLDKVIE